MTGYPVAFADEAFINLRNHPGVYLFAGIIVDSGDLPNVMDAARQAAGAHGPFHATDLYHRGHINPIEDMLDAVQAHAGWNFLIAQAPITGTQEHARQAALTRLLQQLNEQKVRDVVIDTRASPREQVQAQLEGRKVTTADLPDVTTYRNLVRTHQINARMRILHVDDRRQPGLWMADVAAWSFQRALAYDEPQWFSRIIEISSIIDARTGTELSLDSNRAAPPSGERGPEHPSQSAQASLLSRRVYTLNGGTTNRTQGPGQLFTSMLNQIQAASTRDVQQRMLRQVVELNRGVTELSNAIHHTPESALPAVRPASSGVTPEPAPDEPMTAETDISDPAIE